MTGKGEHGIRKKKMYNNIFILTGSPLYEIFIETFNNKSENNSIAKAITLLPILNGTRITILKTISSNRNLLP